jgi:hypothetical protein
VSSVKEYKRGTEDRKMENKLENRSTVYKGKLTSSTEERGRKQTKKDIIN